MNAIKKFLVIAISGLAFTGCFDMTERPYTLLDASNYFTDENSIKQVIAHIYAQEQADLSEQYWYAQELSADQITWRSWNGGSWGWDSGDKFVLSTHTWNPSSNYVNQIWSKAWTAIGLCNNFITDLSNINASTLGISEAQKQAYIDEVRTFRVYCYYNVFEVFGSVIPLTTSTDTSVLPVSAMNGMSFEEGNAKICDWMIEELDGALESLEVNGSVNRCNQAMNRMLKMRILLNSEIFTGVARFDECKALAKDIIDGKYGNYAIAENYKDIYSANNNTDCKEIVFAFSSDVVYNKRSTNMRNGPFMSYVFTAYFNTKEEHAGWNCCCLTPSFDNSDNFYNQCVSFDANGTASVVKNMYDKELAKCFLDGYGDKLGAVMERFDPADIRLVTPYNDAAGNWGGHFMKGVMYADFGNGELQMADADRDGQPLVYVDQVGNFQGKGEHPLQVVENPRWGETNSGIRMAKYPYYNIDSPYNFCDPDVVEFRLAEVYYTYAECLLREGNSAEAKNWVNEVRKRYFSAADWTVAKDRAPRGFDATFDEDRMLSEWGLEFLDEGHRRRTDLRRFDKFTQGQWWFFGRTTETGYDLPAKRDRKYEWFPVPERALAANPGLTQNPAYGG
ncbi:MAG: RagB/SusD family nutrient uptake outer membrane protein [Bacteroidales bacterium]|nr:RagB/SusD family nutrient uptake outer membrane protein [Bacteroidales bacterium]